MLLLAKLFFWIWRVVGFCRYLCVCAGNKRDKMPWASRGFYESLLIFSQNGVYTAAVRARIQMDLGDWSDEGKKGLSGFLEISIYRAWKERRPLKDTPKARNGCWGMG
ncbi:hypothetical protein HII31_05057 [Pseudocercospora fuligena]|uniref:Uncharacterized protein n=1 Tax=Pseudocercospora fuligena TaxID=685502 RepID=A0A8H6RM29_9PEZI|nr:hypothetical protein HII31_05057 [Pseudocercospora fuligena]